MVKILQLTCSNENLWQVIFYWVLLARKMLLSLPEELEIAIF
jgi:hypothetical protein